MSNPEFEAVSKDTNNCYAEPASGDPTVVGNAGLRARLEPFDSFWQTPDHVGLTITSVYELYCRNMFKLYGKNVKILSKKLAAVAYH